MRAYTDYPFKELGDVPRREAPIRECEVISWDGDKYVKIIVEGKELSVKAGYLYSASGRLGEVPTIQTNNLKVSTCHI